ncbi:hypothetical protein EG68_01396 [Paragonimus skrjabini miyazakii]|uniref:Ras-related protein Rab-5C n=1 Tax=Paragonimus skrjabini miyazakii TaxID=59628 RepID=A0A8S9Z1E5_9TREM|nr:hypothetical protein EG68_01396 [Paragonimus skrjabini miyazakii]
MAERRLNSKLVLLGESAVGKSSIVLRFVKSQFSEYQEATIGAAFLTQTVMCGDPQRAVRFEIWDTAGQERYHSLAPMYYRNAQAAIIVYDITNLSSFERAKAWVHELNERANSVKVLALAGNKLDLESQRAVTNEQAQAYATENGLIFMETSAKDCTNITELFTAVALRLPVDTGDEAVEGQQLTAGDASVPGHKCCR